MKRRFIAGAVCPSCGELDRLVVEGEGSAKTRRCVACGFAAADTTAVTGALPGTRLERSNEVEAEPTSGSPVRIVDSSPSPRKVDR